MTYKVLAWFATEWRIDVLKVLGYMKHEDVPPAAEG